MKALIAQDEVTRIASTLNSTYGRLAPARAAGLLHRARKEGDFTRMNLMRGVVNQMMAQISVCNL